jgi:hypothetical protein
MNQNLSLNFCIFVLISRINRHRLRARSLAHCHQPPKEALPVRRRVFNQSSPAHPNEAVVACRSVSNPIPSSPTAHVVRARPKSQGISNIELNYTNY